MAHIEEKLRKLLEQIASEQGYENYNLDITPISSGGANYTSVLYKAKVTEKNKYDLNLFAKVGVLGDDMRDQGDFKVYETERFVYTTIKRIFTEIEEKHKVPKHDRLVITKYYGAHSVFREEILVLEDLTASGFSTYDRLKSADWPYASAAVRELAKFHALAMAFQNEYPEVHEKLCSEFYTEWITEETFNSFMKCGFNKSLEVVKEENREKLKTFLDTLNAETVRNMYKPCRKPVLIHSDYRASNLMHRYKEDDSVELIPVDLQTLRPGCVVVDLIFFIITSTDKDFRRLYFEKLIDHYFMELSAAMTRLGFDSSYYSREDFDFELKEKLPFGLTVAACGLAMITIETEDAPKLENGIDIASFGQCKTSDLFPDRLNGVVDDYVRWGVL